MFSFLPQELKHMIWSFCGIDERRVVSFYQKFSSLHIHHMLERQLIQKPPIWFTEDGFTIWICFLSKKYIWQLDFLGDRYFYFIDLRYHFLHVLLWTDSS